MSLPWQVGETPPVETHDLPSVPARAGDDGTESLADIPAESINTDELENLRDMPEEVGQLVAASQIEKSV